MARTEEESRRPRARASAARGLLGAVGAGRRRAVERVQNGVGARRSDAIVREVDRREDSVGERARHRDGARVADVIVRECEREQRAVAPLERARELLRHEGPEPLAVA